MSNNTESINMKSINIDPSNLFGYAYTVLTYFNNVRGYIQQKMSQTQYNPLLLLAIGAIVIVGAIYLLLKHIMRLVFSFLFVSIIFYTFVNLLCKVGSILEVVAPIGDYKFHGTTVSVETNVITTEK